MMHEMEKNIQLSQFERTGSVGLTRVKGMENKYESEHTQGAALLSMKVLFLHNQPTL